MFVTFVSIILFKGALVFFDYLQNHFEETCHVLHHWYSSIIFCEKGWIYLSCVFLVFTVAMSTDWYQGWASCLTMRWLTICSQVSPPSWWTHLYLFLMWLHRFTASLSQFMSSCFIRTLFPLLRLLLESWLLKRFFMSWVWFPLVILVTLFFLL